MLAIVTVSVWNVPEIILKASPAGGVTVRWCNFSEVEPNGTKLGHWGAPLRTPGPSW